MNFHQFKKLVKSFGGWVEGDVARFPSVHVKNKFEAAFSQIKSAPAEYLERFKGL